MNFDSFGTKGHCVVVRQTRPELHDYVIGPFVNPDDASAFAAGVAANVLNFLVIATLVTRERFTLGPSREQRAAGLAQAAP